MSEPASNTDAEPNFSPPALVDVDVENKLDEKKTLEEEEKEIGLDADFLPVHENEKVTIITGEEDPILPPPTFRDIEPKSNIAVKDNDPSSMINTRLEEIAKSEMEVMLEKYANPPPSFNRLVQPQSMTRSIPFNHLPPQQ